MDGPRYWWVELDDGTGADMHAEINRAVKLEVGEVLQGTSYGRKWRIDRIEPDRLYAHAVPRE